MADKKKFCFCGRLLHDDEHCIFHSKDEGRTLGTVEKKKEKSE